MAAPKTTQWPLDEHTRGKHLVLEEYLKVWCPVMCQSNQRTLFVDGFCGPGRYAQGERGSPLIALETYLDHPARPQWRGEARFYFIDERADRIAALDAALAPLRARIPANAFVETSNGTFAETIAGVRAHLKARRLPLAPAFAMIDPFGVKGVNMVDIAWLLTQKKTEVYVTVMADHMARFCRGDEFPPHMSALYGGDQWTAAKLVEDVDDRRALLLELYEDALRQQAKFVLRFDVYAENDFQYSIFFATNGLKGCTAMKDAIWKAMPGGSYEYRGRAGGQLALGIDKPNFPVFANEIYEVLSVDTWTRVADLDEWASSDRTRFRQAHVRSALRILESEKRIEVERKGRAGTYGPTNTAIRRAGL